MRWPTATPFPYETIKSIPNNLLRSLSVFFHGSCVGIKHIISTSSTTIIEIQHTRQVLQMDFFPIYIHALALIKTFLDLLGALCFHSKWRQKWCQIEIGLPFCTCVKRLPAREEDGIWFLVSLFIPWSWRKNHHCWNYLCQPQLRGLARSEVHTEGMETVA